MLDQNKILKIVDFGFATAIDGEKGDGFLYDFKGTTHYMAPELLACKPYKGAQVDIFAAGVTLFNMVTGTQPFGEASETDFYYNLIFSGETEDFWRKHSQNKPEGSFSYEFKNLIIRIFQHSAEKRPTMHEILTHPWMTGE